MGDRCVLKRWVFSFLRKMVRDSAVLTAWGRSLHHLGAMAEKRRGREERLPGSRSEGTVSCPEDVERRVLVGVYGVIRD